MATRDQAAAQEIVVPDAMLPLQVSGMQAMASKMWMPFIGIHDCGGGANHRSDRLCDRRGPGQSDERVAHVGHGRWDGPIRGTGVLGVGMHR